MKQGRLFLTLLSLALTACAPGGGSSQTQPLDIKFISPSGAPSIIFYEEALNGTLETNSTPQLVGAQLQKDEYTGVVFDFYNGLKSIKNNEADYKLARIITGGNFYLVGIDKTSAPTKDDYIVSFGQNLLPDLVYRSIYGDEIANVTHYVAGVADAGAVLEAGLHEGNEVDYVLVAQPVLFSKMNTSPIKDRLSVVASLRDLWKEKTGQDAIPQAGLFINQTQYANHEQQVEDYLESLEDSIMTCIEDPSTMKQKIEQIGDADAQKAMFGFTGAVAFNVQKDNANGFALVSTEESETIDIQAFLNSIGKGNEDYSNYIM